MTHQSTIELKHPKGVVVISVSSESADLASHVSNSIRKQFNKPPQGKSVDDVFRSFGDIFGNRK